MTTNKADMIFASLPYAILHEFQIPLYQQMKARDAEFYAGLEKAGFWLDRGDDSFGSVHEIPAPRAITSMSGPAS
jgi:putative flavoprotein involved in K+ transport